MSCCTASSFLNLPGKFEQASKDQNQPGTMKKTQIFTNVQTLTTPWAPGLNSCKFPGCPMTSKPECLSKVTS